MSSMPSLPPTSVQMRAESPDSMTVLLTPMAFSVATASAASLLTTSDTTMCPMYLPSTATCTFVPATSSSQYSAPMSFMSLWLPTCTVLPCTTARTPFPGISSADSTAEASKPEVCASMIDLEMGWLDTDSACAAVSSSSSSAIPTECTQETSNLPSVRVPVLSNTTVSVLDRDSRKLLPLTRIPSLDAAPMPQK